jgi:tetratricopeptide (TPR) repeat protein
MKALAKISLPIAFAVILAIVSRAQSPSFEQAVQLFQQHRWAEAAAAFAEYENTKSIALLYRGKALVNLEQFDAASAALEKYRETYPRSEDAAYLLAYIRFRQNKPKESLQLFTEAAKLKDPTADDLKAVALDYVLLGDYDDAAKYLQESLAQDPANIEARYHLGRVRYQQNRFDLAIAAFEEVLTRDPGNVKAEDNLGLSLEARNEIDPAIAAYRKAIGIDEKQQLHNGQPYLDLGTLLVKSNRTAEAIPLLVRATVILPNAPQAHYELAKAYLDLSRLEAARVEAERAVSLDSNESSNHYLLGRIYQRSGKSEFAKEQFRLTEQLIHAKDSSLGSGMASGTAAH